MHSVYNVAIADDNSEALKFLRHSVVRAGHRIVLEVNTGEDLVERCVELVPDLIITDVKMQGIDGLEAAEQILTHQEIPVIIVSGFDPDHFADRADLCRPLAYLTKPIRDDQLQATIEVAMRRFSELQSLRSEASSMRQALEDRKIVERAKGVVMRERALDEANAHKFLQTLARRHRQKLVDVAKSINLADEITLAPHKN